MEAIKQVLKRQEFKDLGIIIYAHTIADVRPAAPPAAMVEETTDEAGGMVSFLLVLHIPADGLVQVAIDCTFCDDPSMVMLDVLAEERTDSPEHSDQLFLS